MQTFEMNGEEHMQESKFKNKFWTHLGCTVPRVHGWRGLVQRTGAELQLLQAQICCSESSLPTIPAKREHVLSCQLTGGTTQNSRQHFQQPAPFTPNCPFPCARSALTCRGGQRGRFYTSQFREGNNAALTHLLKTEHAS